MSWWEAANLLEDYPQMFPELIYLAHTLGLAEYEVGGGPDVPVNVPVVLDWHTAIRACHDRHSPPSSAGDLWFAMNLGLVQFADGKRYPPGSAFVFLVHPAKVRRLLAVARGIGVPDGKKDDEEP